MTGRQNDRETERQRDRETERQRNRMTERQSDRETENRETEKHTNIFNKYIYYIDIICDSSIMNIIYII